MNTKHYAPATTIGFTPYDAISDADRATLINAGVAHAVSNIVDPVGNTPITGMREAASSVIEFASLGIDGIALSDETLERLGEDVVTHVRRNWTKLFAVPQPLDYSRTRAIEAASLKGDEEARRTIGLWLDLGWSVIRRTRALEARIERETEFCQSSVPYSELTVVETAKLAFARAYRARLIIALDWTTTRDRVAALDFHAINCECADCTDGDRDADPIRFDGAQ